MFGALRGRVRGVVAEEVREDELCGGWTGQEGDCEKTESGCGLHDRVGVFMLM